MTASKPSTPKAIEAWHRLMEWLLPLLDHYPRTRRFTLATRIENLLLEVLELLIEAAYTQHKHPLLQQANRKLELLRHLWRLSHRLRYISMKRYEHGIRLIDEPGRQIGGWLKQQTT
jgi:hypothetical protein